MGHDAQQAVSTSWPTRTAMAARRADRHPCRLGVPGGETRPQAADATSRSSIIRHWTGGSAAEIEVNRAFAPAIYRGVLAITREADGRLAIGGKGAPVEWAVEMARFDETQTLDHLAAAVPRRAAGRRARPRGGAGARGGAGGRGAPACQQAHADHRRKRSRTARLARIVRRFGRRADHDDARRVAARAPAAGRAQAQRPGSALSAGDLHCRQYRAD